MADEDQNGGAPQETAGDPPYAQYLAQIPEELRGQVEPVFREWDGQVTQRFQEAADFRKRFEPLAEIGVDQIGVDELKWFQDFRTAYSENPQAIAAWYEDYAKANGLTPAQAQEAAAGFAPEPDLESLLEQRLGPVTQELQALREWRDTQERQRAEQEAMREIEGQFKALADKHGDFPRETVEGFVGRYIQTDPNHAVERAFGDYQALVATIEKRVLADKLGQPPAAESGGAPATAPDRPPTLAEAAKMSTERLRAAMSA